MTLHVPMHGSPKAAAPSTFFDEDLSRPGDVDGTPLIGRATASGDTWAYVSSVAAPNYVTDQDLQVQRPGLNLGRTTPSDRGGNSGAFWYYDTGNNDEMWLECDVQTLAARGGINVGLALGINPSEVQNGQRCFALLRETTTSMTIGFWWPSGEGHAAAVGGGTVNVTTLPQTIRCTLQRNTPIAGTSRLTVTPLDEPGNAATYDYDWASAQTGSACGVHYNYRYSFSGYGPIRIGAGLSP